MARIDEQSDSRQTAIPLTFQRGEIMAEVIGRLITDLHSNGTVRMTFIQRIGGGFERPQTAKNLGMAEKEFINTPGLPPDMAAALRAQLERDKMADAAMSVDAMVADTFRNHPLRRD
jgi:hypothetical protein